MSRQKVEELQDKVNAVSQRYDARFAGKPRATRQLSELDEITAELEQLIEEGQSLHNGDNTLLREVLSTAQNNLEMYKTERGEIESVLAKGPEAIKGAKLATWANFVFDEYHRHYAGKNRSTRDIGRLEEMVAELEGVREDMISLLAKRSDLESTRKDIETIENNLDLYEGELENILNARRQGTREERAGSLANAGNEQFSVYNAQFAGRGRSTRRPELLERVIKNLEGILNEMRLLNSKGYRSEHNTKNINIVQTNLNLYRDEVAAIRDARAQHSVEDMAGLLGGAANDVMGRYREGFAGQSRVSRELSKLSGLCDEMYEIALQMRSIQDDLPDLEMNNRNLSIVIDNLIVYQNEYRAIEEAKGQS